MYKTFWKEIIDLVVGVILLVLLAPLLLLVAILIKLTSPGPIFFKQLRGGKGGNYFQMYKFRSMTVDREAESKHFEPGTQSRITGIGKILRKTKLDEFPQLINVLKGEMSLIGPRPEVRPYIELFPDRWAKVLSITPGISDPSSIKFRNEEEQLEKAKDPEKEYREVVLPHKLDLYEEYVDNISFISDVKIFFATIFTVLFH